MIPTKDGYEFKKCTYNGKNFFSCQHTVWQLLGTEEEEMEGFPLCGK